MVKQEKDSFHAKKQTFCRFFFFLLS